MYKLFSLKTLETFMKISCPRCDSSAIRKNGSTHSGKQKYECLSCGKQFVEDPQNKIIPDETTTVGISVKLLRY